MATSKTLTPTNVTIQIPEFTDQPDQRVNSNCIDKEADAINALNGKKANCSDIAYIEATSTASRNYAAGDFIYVEGVLRRASYAISSGTTISGSNSSKITNGAASYLSDQLAALNGNINNRCHIVTKNYSSGSATALLNDLIIDAFAYISNNSLSTAVFGGTLSGTTQYSAVISKYAGGNFASGMVNIGGDIYSVQYNANNQTVTKYKATMTSA